MSKKTHDHVYICLCDVFRPDGNTLGRMRLYERTYRGRYIIRANNERKALKLFRKACPFGSLQIYYQDDKFPSTVKFPIKPNSVYKSTVYGYFLVDLKTQEVIGYKEARAKRDQEELEKLKEEEDE